MTNNSAFFGFMFAETISKFTDSANLNIGFTKPAVLVTAVTSQSGSSQLG